MAKYLPIVLLSAVALVVGAALLVTSVQTRNDQQDLSLQQDEQRDSTLLAPESSSWSERLFHHGLATSTADQATEPDLLGGVIPHHQVGSRLIFDLLGRLPTSTQRVILLLPDHYQLTAYPAYTTSYSWKTPFGILNSDREVIYAVAQSPLVELLDTESILQEHALGGLVPYIKYHLPQAQIVPVALANQPTQAELDVLVDTLMPLVSDNTVVLATIDFSHDLPLELSQQRDTATWQYIVDQDWSTILGLSDEYLDSPAALYVAHQLLTNAGASQPVLLQSANSRTELGQIESLGTSYLEIGWYADRY